MKRVLIVDDDPGIVEKLALLLGERYEVAVASTGFDALRSLDAGGCDVLLVDLIMPGLDGVGLVRELHAHHSQVPIILMSASPALHVRARELGVSDYLVKPFDIESLELVLERHVGA